MNSRSGGKRAPPILHPRRRNKPLLIPSPPLNHSPLRTHDNPKRRQRIQRRPSLRQLFDILHRLDMSRRINHTSLPIPRTHQQGIRLGIRPIGEFFGGPLVKGCVVVCAGEEGVGFLDLCGLVILFDDGDLGGGTKDQVAGGGFHCAEFGECGIEIGGRRGQKEGTDDAWNGGSVAEGCAEGLLEAGVHRCVDIGRYTEVQRALNPRLER
jgi:hypothetical protein